MLAVTTYEWLKSANVLAAVMWVGGAVMLTATALTLTEKAEPAVRTAPDPVP